MPKTSKTTRQPRLSDLGIDLLHLTKWQVTRTIALPFAACAAFWILAGSHHWMLAVFALMILSFVTYGSTSHDLVHGSLGLKRLPNDIFLAVIEESRGWGRRAITVWLLDVWPSARKMPLPVA